MKDRTRITLKLFLPQRRKPDPDHAIPESDQELRGKTVVFTGGTDGLGRGAVDRLYGMGAHVVLLGRNREKSEKVIREIGAKGGRGSFNLQICDLASMESVKACANRILEEESRIDVLVNCAGINLTKEVITGDGFEMNWAINYLGHYLLTNLLLPRIRENRTARIVNLTTNTAFIEEIDFDYIASRGNFASKATYVESKLSINMFSLDLAKELEGTGVTVNYLYPGYIKTNLLSNLRGAAKMMQFFMNVMASPTEVGADRVVRLALSSEFEGMNGAYLAEDRITPPHREAQIASKRSQLREITNKALAPWLEKNEEAL